MAHGKYPGTNRNYFPGWGVEGGSGTSAATVQGYWDALFTPTNQAAWFVNGRYGFVLCRPTWGAYLVNNGAVRPTDPSDFEDAIYDWSTLESFADMSAVVDDGAKLFIEAGDRYSVGAPIYLSNPPYNGTWVSNNGKIIKHYRYGSVGAAPPIVEEELYFLQALHDKIVDLGIVDKIGGILLSEASQNGLNTPTDYNDVDYRNGRGYRDQQAQIIFDDINITVYTISPSPVSAAWWDAPLVGFANPDLKPQFNEPPTSARGYTEVQGGLRPILQQTQVNGQVNTTWGENPLGHAVGSVSLMTPQEALWYCATIRKCDHIVFNWSSNGATAPWAGATGLANIIDGINTYGPGGSNISPPVPAAYDVVVEEPESADAYVDLIRTTAPTTTDNKVLTHALGVNAKISLLTMTSGLTLGSVPGDGARIAFGANTATQQIANAFLFTTNIAPSGLGILRRDDAALALTNGGSTNEDGRIAYSSTDTDAVTYTVPNAFASAYQLKSLILGGDDVSASVIQHTLDTEDAAVNFNFGFDPLFARIIVSEEPFDESGTASRKVLSICYLVRAPDDSTKIVSPTFFINNNAGTLELASVVSTAYAGGLLDSLGAFVEGIEVTTRGDLGGGQTGIALTLKLDDTTPLYVSAEAIDVANSYADLLLFNAPTSIPGSVTTYNTAGLQPSALILVTTGHTAVDTAKTGNNAAIFCEAFATASGAQCDSFRIRNTGTGDQNSRPLSDSKLINMPQHDGTAGNVCTFDSLNPTDDPPNFKANHTSVISGNASLMAAIVIAFGEASTPDTDAPQNETTPSISSYDDNELHITGQISENGTAYSAIYWPETADPTSAAVKAGTGAIATDTASATASTPFTLNFTSLVGPEYKWAEVNEDAVPNLQTSPTVGTQILSSPSGTFRVKVPDLTGRTITEESLFYGLSAGDWVEYSDTTDGGRQLAIDNDGYPHPNFGDDAEEDDSFDWRPWNATTHAWASTQSYDYEADIALWESEELHNNTGSLIPEGTSVHYGLWANGNTGSPRQRVADDSNTAIVNSAHKIQVQFLPGGEPAVWGVVDDDDTQLWSGDFIRI